MRRTAPTLSFEGCYPCPGTGHPFPSGKSQAHICAQTEVTTIPSWHAGILWDIVQGCGLGLRLRWGLGLQLGFGFQTTHPEQLKRRHIRFDLQVPGVGS